MLFGICDYFVPYHHEELNYDRVSKRTLPGSLVQVCPVCVSLWPILSTDLQPGGKIIAGVFCWKAIMSF